MPKKQKKIKARRIWTRNPKEQIIPNRKKDDLLRGQKITEEDFEREDYGEFKDYERR